MAELLTAYWMAAVASLKELEMSLRMWQMEGKIWHWWQVLGILSGRVDFCRHHE
jgi:hypothetical protein